ncbi:hypothetical protein U1Q18_016121 [Sarracenia purpurea var. burkii]
MNRSDTRLTKPGCNVDCHLHIVILFLGHTSTCLTAKIRFGFPRENPSVWARPDWNWTGLQLISESDQFDSA